MTRKIPARSSALAQNIKERPAMLEPLRLAAEVLPGLAMVCVLCGITYRGSGLSIDLAPPYEPPPLSPNGQAQTATGKLHCSFATFLD